jgi:hypothetical protein
VDPVTGFTNAGRTCADGAVILGSAGKIVCPGGSGYALWNINPGDPTYGVHPINMDRASVVNPVLMRSPNISATTGNAASFTWDGQILLFTSLPGGGTQANCQTTGANAGSTDRNKSIRFFDVTTGTELGRHVLPRPQSATENCALGSINVVPLPRQDSKPLRYVAVHGSFQAGVGVVEFTDIRNPSGLVTDPAQVSGGAQHANLTSREIAFADPAPLSTTTIILGGSWSAYWYNGQIFNSDIRHGLFLWKLADKSVAGALKLPYLNPQTQSFTID